MPKPQAPSRWEDRERQLCDVVRSRPVQKALAAYRAFDSKQRSTEKMPLQQTVVIQEQHDLDLATTLLWSAQLQRRLNPNPSPDQKRKQKQDTSRSNSSFSSSFASSFSGAWRSSLAPGNSSNVVDPNSPRRLIASTFQTISQAARSLPTHADFDFVTALEGGNTGTVSVMRAKADGCLYVVKNVVKGIAARERCRVVPMMEREILLRGGGGVSSDPMRKRGQEAEQEEEWTWTPRLFAAFQSPASLHYVLEYFPAGDLSSLLDAINELNGKSGDGYVGARNPTGGSMSEAWLRSYVIDIVAAVGWMHTEDFAHR